jgi:hypothetical protein
MAPKQVSIQIAANNLVSETQSSMPIFTKETLVQMKVDQLKEICRKYNIKQGKNKASLIDNIVARSTTLHQNINELLQSRPKLFCSNYLYSFKIKCQTKWRMFIELLQSFVLSHKFLQKCRERQKR